MKSTARFAFIALLSSHAMAASSAPPRPPLGHPLVGTWEWTRGENNCTEVYAYRADGSAPVVSGTERTDNVYSVSRDPDANGFYRMTIRTTKDYGGTDCADDASDSTGVESTIFLLFSPARDQFIVCSEPRLQRCFGPLRRTAP